MRTLFTKLGFIVFCFWITSQYGQINPNVNTGNTFDKDIKEITTAVPVKKIKISDYEDLTSSDIKTSNSPKLEIPKDYLSKPSKKSWKITPDRAFGPGNLGFGFHNGKLWRSGFQLINRFVSSESQLFVGFIEFDARSGKEYLIRINPRQGANSNSYIYTLTDRRTYKVYGQNSGYLILVRAMESGKMHIPISARHTVGGNERYPEVLLIYEITIDEL